MNEKIEYTLTNGSKIVTVAASASNPIKSIKTPDVYDYKAFDEYNLFTNKKNLKEVAMIKFMRMGHGRLNNLTKKFYQVRREKGNEDPYLCLKVLKELVVEKGKFTTKEDKYKRLNLKEISYLTDKFFADIRVNLYKGQYDLFPFKDAIEEDSRKMVQDIRMRLYESLQIK